MAEPGGVAKSSKKKERKITIAGTMLTRRSKSGNPIEH